MAGLDIRSGFYLDKWFVCPKELVLFDGQEHQRLEPKVMEVLVYLHDNLNEVVSREQLIENVWHGRYASDESITRVISVLRRAFNESHQAQRLIKTIPKQGYQLCWQQLPGEQVPDFTSLHQQLARENMGQPKEQGSAKRMMPEKYLAPLLILLALISVLTLGDFFLNHNGQPEPVADEQVSILVAPFTSLDGSHVSQKAAALVENDLKYTLSNIRQPTINVLSVLEGQKPQQSDFMLNGSVVAQQDMLQIEVAFIDARSSLNIWQHRFYFQIEDYHKLLNIVRDTIGHYFTLLTPAQYRTTRIEEVLPRILIERAKVMRRSFDVEKVQAAMELLENASLLYPEHQQILPELAFTQLELLTLEQMTGQQSAPLNLTVETVTPGSELAQAPLMKLSQLIRRFQQGDLLIGDLIKQAMALQPEFINDVEFFTLLGNWHKEAGNYQAAESYFKQAIAVDQGYAKSHYCLAELQSLLGNNELAINTLSLYLRNFPQQPMLQYLSLKLYLSIGLFDQVIYSLKHFKLSYGAGFDGNQPSFFIQAYGFLNRPERVLEVTDELTTSAQPISVNQVSCWLPPSINIPLATPDFCLKRAKRAEGVSDDVRNLLLIARHFMLNENYDQAVVYFEKVAQASTNLSLAAQYALQADLTFAYAMSGQLTKAKAIGEGLLDKLNEAPRLGLSGAGINDVVILIALERLNDAHAALNRAVNAGWLHWYHWQYRGPHPALTMLAKAQPLDDVQSTINDKLERLYNLSN